MIVSVAMVLLLRKWMGMSLMRSYLLRCCSYPSLLKGIGVPTFSILLKLLLKSGMLIYCTHFLYSDVALDLCKGTIRPCIWYCDLSGLVLQVATWILLEKLKKLQKWVSRAVVSMLLLHSNPCFIWNQTKPAKNVLL